MEHCNDIFADAVPSDTIGKVLEQCRQYPENSYLLHTKNPTRYREFFKQLPPNCFLGCTVETNRPTPNVSCAPAPLQRIEAMIDLPGRKLITIEPILDFDLDELVSAIRAVKPEIVAIGADSKGTGLVSHKGSGRDFATCSV